MAPGPLISAIVYVSFGLMTTNGFTFHPCPNSLALFAALPFCSVAIPPFPGPPVGFSGLIERLFASLKRNKLPGFMLRPLKAEELCALAIEEIKTTNKRIFLIRKVLNGKRY